MTGASAIRGRLLLQWAIAASATVALDQWTKALALARLATGAEPLIGPIQFKLTRNPGSAFGLPTPPWAAISVSIIVCVVVLVYLLRSAQARPRWSGVALGLVVGGAIGNLVDRVRMGAVVDFIDLRVWPVFNVADIAITLGVVFVMIGVLGKR